MSQRSLLSRADTLAATPFPPLNPDCPLCFNLDAVKLQTKIVRVNLYSTDRMFWNSALYHCLACRLVYESVFRFTREAGEFSSVELNVRDVPADDQSEGSGGKRTKISWLRQLLLKVTRTEYDVETGTSRMDMAIVKPKTDTLPLWYQMDAFDVVLEVYAQPGSPSQWHVVPSRPEPAASSLSDATMARAKEWLTKCLLSHGNCIATETDVRNKTSTTRELLLSNLEEPPVLPTRVVYVGRKTAADKSCLVMGNGKRAHYVALSWRWGEQKLVTTTKNINEHCAGRWESGLPGNALPQLFEEATQVARKLGVDYLWIDALCIQQDSREDWASESALMAQVYGNALFTIAADACVGSDQSLSGPESLFSSVGAKTLLKQPLLYGGPEAWENTKGKDCYDIRGKYAIATDGPFRNLRRARYPLRYHMPEDAGTREQKEQGTFCVRPAVTCNIEGYHGSEFVPESILLRRGWCFQENILSRRVLHFGPTEVSWQCLEMEACECIDGTRPLPTREIKDASGDTLEVKKLISGSRNSVQGTQSTTEYISDTEALFTWMCVVESFTSRGLTKTTDRLVAVGGLADKMKPLFRRDHTPNDSLVASSRYLHGAWVKELHSLLAWFCKPPAHRFTLKQTESARLQNNTGAGRTPTWSWGSVTGQIQFYTNAWFNVLHVEKVPSVSLPTSPSSESSDETAVIVQGHLLESVQLMPVDVGRSQPAMRWGFMSGWWLYCSFVKIPQTGVLLNEPVLLDTWTFAQMRSSDPNQRKTKMCCAVRSEFEDKFWILLQPRTKTHRNAAATTTPSGIPLYERIGVIYPGNTATPMRDNEKAFAQLRRRASFTKSPASIFGIV